MSNNVTFVNQKYECYYCDRVFPNNFMMKEHISYGHNALREVYGSKFYKDVYSRIKKLESELEEKNKIINSMEERILQLSLVTSQISQYHKKGV